MIEYDKITKKALYAKAEWMEAKIAELNETAAQAEAAQEEAKYAEELADYARTERDDAKFQLSNLQERLGIAGMAILERGAGTE